AAYTLLHKVPSCSCETPLPPRIRASLRFRVHYACWQLQPGSRCRMVLPKRRFLSQCVWLVARQSSNDANAVCCCSQSPEPRALVDASLRFLTPGFGVAASPRELATVPEDVAKQLLCRRCTARFGPTPALRCSAASENPREARP